MHTTMQPIYLAHRAMLIGTLLAAMQPMTVAAGLALRVEYAAVPLGLDPGRPIRLSWAIAPPGTAARGIVQRQFRISVVEGAAGAAAAGGLRVSPSLPTSPPPQHIRAHTPSPLSIARVAWQLYGVFSSPWHASVKRPSSRRRSDPCSLASLVPLLSLGDINGGGTLGGLGGQLWVGMGSFQSQRCGGRRGSSRTGTSLSGSISTILTVLSWICAGVYMCGALPSPVCA